MSQDLYTQNNFDLLQDPDVPNKALQFFVERGFNCHFHARDLIRREDREFTESLYFKATRPYFAEHFWLRIYFDPIELEEQKWYWGIEIGDLIGFEGEWKPSITIDGQERMAQFSFQAWSEGHSDMELMSHHDRGKVERDVNPTLLSLDVRLRKLLARGWHWLGAPLEEVLKLTGTEIEVSAHDKIEWIAQRKDDLRDYRRLQIVESALSKVNPEDGGPDMLEHLTRMKATLENENNGPVTWRDVSTFSGISYQQIMTLVNTDGREGA